MEVKTIQRPLQISHILNPLLQHLSLELHKNNAKHIEFLSNKVVARESVDTLFKEFLLELFSTTAGMIASEVYQESEHFFRLRVNDRFDLSYGTPGTIYFHKPNITVHTKALFLKVNSQRVFYDTITGKNNIAAISTNLSIIADNWAKEFYKVYETNQDIANIVDYAVKNGFGSSQEKFERAVAYMIASIILSKVAAHIIKNRRLLHKVPQINVALINSLHNLSILLEHRIDYHIEELDKLSKREKDTNKLVDLFAKDIVFREMFAASGLLFSEYEKILTIMTNYAFLENRLRDLFASIVQQNLVYDSSTGRNNIVALSSEILNIVNHWLTEFYSAYQRNHQVSSRLDSAVIKLYGGDVSRFARAILLLVITTLVSKVAIKLLKNTVNSIEEAKKETDMIYANKFSYDQYLLLKRHGLVGNILFRGLIVSDQELNAYLNAGWSSHGTSWTSDWKTASMFALIRPYMLNFEHVYGAKELTFGEFKAKMDNMLRDKLEFYDKLYAERNWYVVKRISDIKQIMAYTHSKGFIIKDIPVILSYNILQNRKSSDFLIYVGYHRKNPDNMRKAISEAESIFLPHRLMCTDSSLDMYLHFGHMIATKGSTRHQMRPSGFSSY